MIRPAVEGCHLAIIALYHSVEAHISTLDCRTFDVGN